MTPTRHGNLIEECRGTVSGVVAAVPKNRVTNRDWPAAHDAARMTGVLERRHVSGTESADTLCAAAARTLMDRLHWEPESIDALVYVTQTPATAVPASAYALHAELGLPAHCPAVEVNWSCAGYVYGLWLAMKLGQRGDGMGCRVLLLVGDTTSRIVDPADRATAPLFGDAGSATGIITGSQAGATRFVLGTDGAGAGKLSKQLSEGAYLRMDGAAVFSFTLSVVPGLVADVIEAPRAAGTEDAPEFLLFHQANRFMLEHLVKKTGLLQRFKPAQIPMNIEQFGNCSCASIPLLLCTELGGESTRGALLHLLGYGAGWSWAGATVNASDLRVAEMIEV